MLFHDTTNIPSTISHILSPAHPTASSSTSHTSNATQAIFFPIITLWLIIRKPTTYSRNHMPILQLSSDINA
ncbi:hypothetical protein [Prevotella sp.]|uniref:hypothetical protein n=1 Tax=Prevotella sp. TaxID=59823 RepID=UPI00307C4AEB